VLEVSLPEGGSCSTRFDYRKQGDGIPQIGPLTCTEKGTP
jgi:outer membrane usher protein